MLLGSAAQSVVCQNAVPNAVPKSTVPGNEVEPAAAEGDPGQMLFQAMCSACHLPDRMHVGPSLVEIAGLYRDKRGGYRWRCFSPANKKQVGKSTEAFSSKKNAENNARINGWKG